jgi:protein gp37
MTKIAWTDVTDNIIVAADGGWWCRKISDGCTNCYAARLNQSDYFHGNKLPYSGEPPKLLLKSNVIKAWARQTKSKKHFVASMTDVFGEWVSRDWQYEMLDGMRAAPSQIFQVLTKRADVAVKAMCDWKWLSKIKTPPANIWLGFSAENQEAFNLRWPYMRTLAYLGFTVFASLEPLLSPIQLPNDFLLLHGDVWVITGGESGPKARPCDISNIRSIVEQCKASGVACFVKQLGAKPFMGVKGFGPPIRDSKGGDPSEWPEDLRIREFPARAPNA